MARRTRTYVAFDADSDIHYYRLMQAWKANDGIEFDFNNAHELTTIRETSGEEVIKASLRERMKNSKILVVLVGDNTKYLRKYVPWEIEIAMKADLPIIVVNLNGKKTSDSSLCPKLIQDELAIHIPFGIKIMQYALDHWPGRHSQLRSQGESGAYSYSADFYEKLENKSSASSSPRL